MTAAVPTFVFKALKDDKEHCELIALRLLQQLSVLAAVEEIAPIRRKNLGVSMERLSQLYCPDSA